MILGKYTYVIATYELFFQAFPEEPIGGDLVTQHIEKSFPYIGHLAIRQRLG